jgi:hypothetical protein
VLLSGLLVHDHGIPGFLSCFLKLDLPLKDVADPAAIRAPGRPGGVRPGFRADGPLGPAGESVSEQRETQASGDRNVLLFDKTWNLGYYTWRVPQKNVAGGLFATNPDGAESDLAEIADDKLRTDFAAKETHVAAGLKELEKRFEDTARRELWQYVLLACLILAVCEPLIANWMRPERTRDTAHPTVGKKKAA